MNYYNPYFYSMPSATNLITRPSLFARLFGNSGITFGKILNGTQRALSFANQAIPFVKQVRPMIGNAKTMFKVMNEFKRIQKPNNNYNQNNNFNEKNNIKRNDNIAASDYGPTFFM